jgi:hypothetical protein
MSCCVLLFLSTFNLDDNLAHNATRSSLLNELHFILIRLCIFLCPKYVFVFFYLPYK